MKEKRHEEEKMQAQQTESYTSTMSHEMRTPLSSLLFLLKYLFTFLAGLPEQNEKTERAKKYLDLI